MSRAAAGAAMVLLALSSAASADKTYGAIVEMTGGASWRTSIGQDPNAPGFNAITGGLDLLVGLDLAGAVGVVTGGRLRAGSSGGSRYLELAGDFGAQLHLGDGVRARAGVDAGRAYVEGVGSSLLVGGWVAVAIDLFALATNRAAVALAVRLDIGGFPGGGNAFPAGTLGLTAGVGWRY